jgi:TonB family protein
MLSAIVAAAALAAAPAPDPANVLETPPDPPRFVERPSPGAYASAYPRGAESRGVGGEVMLDCQASRTGRMESCKVSLEAPSGAGFGDAALGLAKAFRISPADGDGPARQVRIPIGFATQSSDSELLIKGPWVSAPGFADIAGAYPDIGGGVTGEVVLHCAIGRDGWARGCKSLYEHPADRDFGVAALKIAHKFRLRIDTHLAGSGVPLAANVVMRMPAPDSADILDRRIHGAVWAAAPDPSQMAQLFPAPAAAKGVNAGVGAVDCTVGADGALTACQAGPAEPPDVGFSEAALKAVSALRLAAWSAAGGPVEGASVRVPIRFSRPRAP